MTTFDTQQASPPAQAVSRLGPTDVLVLAAWCGLTAGELEVAARILIREFTSLERISGITRHFVWLTPLMNLLLFLGVAGLFTLAMRLSPRRAAWWSPRIIITLSIFPALLIVAGRSIYSEALLLLALGVAICIARVLERHPSRWPRWLALSIPVLLGSVALQAGWVFGGDWIKQEREDSRPLPPGGSPNVLLIVLDTVRADHLSLYGYPRPTTPNLERLARRGIRFDQARSAAPWTLPSHANMFTGKWPHELDVKWMCPVGDDALTLAEYLGSLGYATAGFVGNTAYCSYSTGLERGFTHYEDYVLDTINAARSLRLVIWLLKISGNLARLYSPISTATLMKFSPEGQRKEARVVNDEFLNWLSHRRDPERPFFAFLNYIDAHWPYILPRGESYRLGPGKPNDEELRFLSDARWAAVDKRHLPEKVLGLERDGYDNCVAYLDKRLGELFDDLERRAILERTLVIVTADHGEGFGEHGLFDHGESLYNAEIRVPLLIVLPADRRSARGAVGGFVSLRDLPATVVDLIGQGKKSPFPGQSLAHWWANPRVAATPPPSATEAAVRSELAEPSPANPNQGRGPAHRGPLVSLAIGDFVYIRNQGDGGEELFNQRGDPGQLHNLAGNQEMLPVLQRFRDMLAR